MGEFTFKLEQEDADDFSLEVCDGFGCTWRIPMQTRDAVALWVAVNVGIGDYMGEMRAAKAEFDAGLAIQREYDAEEYAAYELDDPKHPTYHDRYAAFYDDRDKGAVGP